MGETDEQIASSIDFAALRQLHTPCYVYNPSRAIRDYTDLKRMLGTELIVSIKANPDPDLLAACVPAFVDGIELASQRELGLVVGAKVRKFVNTPGLTSDLLRAARAAGATMVLDNLCQVDLLLAESRAQPGLPVIFRLNSGELLPESSRRGPTDRFGMSLSDLIEAGMRLRTADVALRGIHVFAGSNMFGRWAFPLGERMRTVVTEIEQRLGQRFEFLNLGGGIPPDWRSLKFDFEGYRRALLPLQDGRVLAHEAGRAIFTGCGSFLTRVLSRKRLSGHQIVACDGGMVHSFQLAQTELPTKLYRTPRLVYADERRARALEPLLFVGNTCSNVDRIGRLEAGVPLPEPGDYVVFEAVGAYFATYTLSGFLGIPPARAYIRPELVG